MCPATTLLPCPHDVRRNNCTFTFHLCVCVCVCVCVCERERERERDSKSTQFLNVIFLNFKQSTRLKTFGTNKNLEEYVYIFCTTFCFIKHILTSFMRWATRTLMNRVLTVLRLLYS